ncbi:type II CRISPR RNA-guided endonuclease Cas9 [Spirochaeta cellobiosiphila]|uniref:type II CRISPR RNA-guided endonuclease Cas9 n=1 Tax=Spirochaeta cellobiosiphila TaxID=504483 RepID=UPI0003F6E1C0|nr:type II CRISPR RNA-guided endonuclease Cas9 [Spirochaeta cellobiosiphila]
MGKARLGIDLGTNSLGWALFDMEEDHPFQLKDAGVRIFPDGRESAAPNKVGESKAVQRRVARSMRRRRDRKLSQKSKLVQVLIDNELLPQNQFDRKNLARKDPLRLRAEALDRKLARWELGRVLFSLVLRRGFKSNRLEQQKDPDSVNYKMMDALSKAIEDSGKRTLGEFLYDRHKRRQPIRFRPESGFYPQRDMYEKEFDLIREVQEPYYANVNWDYINRIIFFQRPLKPQPRGVCEYMSDKLRAYKALPSSQQFRIWQDIENLRFLNSDGSSIPLANDQKNSLYHILSNQKSVTFKKLHTLFFPNIEGKFNFDIAKKTGMKGNELEVFLRKSTNFGPLWDSLSLVEKDAYVERILSLYTDEEEVKLTEDLLKIGVPEANIDEILGHHYPEGTTSLCKEIQQELCSVIAEQHIPYDKAVVVLGYHHSVRDIKGGLDTLPYYGEVLTTSCIGGSKKEEDKGNPEKYYGKIGNPTVHVALNQLRAVVNDLIRKQGKPTQIVVELSRDLKNSRQKVEEYRRLQANNEKENEAITKEIVENPNYGIRQASRSDIRKYKLYKEQMIAGDGLGSKCPYCGKVIGASEIFTPNIEIEHILPYSRTLDDSMMNKVVAHRTCNQIKRNSTPYEAFSHDPEGYSYSDILRITGHYPKAKARRFRQDAMERYLEEGGEGFYASQLTDNAYIARVAIQYLRSICPDVWSSTGKATALLRAKWGLNTILSKSKLKSRADHRHHAVDAAVIAHVDRSLIKKMADLNRNNLLGSITVPSNPELRQQLEARIDRMIPSIKPDHGVEGKLFQETAYGKVTLNLPLAVSLLKEDHIRLISGHKLRSEYESRIKEMSFKKFKAQLIQEGVTDVYLRKEVWVTTVPVDEDHIKYKDLAEMTWDGKLQGICDPHMRKKLASYCSKDGDLSKNDLKKFVQDSGIKRVRYIPKSQEITPIASMPQKGYQVNDYVYVDIWEVPSKKKGGAVSYKGVFVSRYDANQKGYHYTKPHPAAKRLMRLYKNDVIKVSHEQDVWYYRIAGYSTTTNCLDIRSVWASEDNKNWIECTSSKRIKAEYPDASGQVFKTLTFIFKQGKVEKVKITPVM